VRDRFGGFRAASWHLRRIGDLDTEGKDYVARLSFAGGLSVAFIVAACALKTSRHLSWVARFCALDQTGRLVIGEMHSSHARIAELRP
jgi:hypothetical protein